MRARVALLVGGAAVAAAAAYRLLRPAPAPPLPDPHAEELRAKLAESRVVVEDRDEFDAAETPVDQAQDVPPAELGDRRKAVHDRGRHIADEMRRGSSS